MLYSTKEKRWWLTVNKFSFKKRRAGTSQARVLICPEGSLRMEMLFGMQFTRPTLEGGRLGEESGK